MKSLVILGAGTGGTTLAHRLAPRLPGGWRVTVVDAGRSLSGSPGPGPARARRRTT